MVLGLWNPAETTVPLPFGANSSTGELDPLRCGEGMSIPAGIALLFRCGRVCSSVNGEKGVVVLEFVI